MSNFHHFKQWKHWVILANIFETLASRNILKGFTSFDNWRNDIDLILNQLYNYIFISKPKNDYIKLTANIDYFYSVRIMSIPRKGDSLKDGILLKQRQILDTIIDIYKSWMWADVGVWFSPTSIFKPDIENWIDFRRVREWDNISEDTLKKLNNNLDDILSGWNIDISFSIDSNVFIEDLIRKLLPFKGSESKNNFVDKFESRKDKKEKEAKKYFRIGIWIFTLILIWNLVMFWFNLDKSFWLTEFWKNFLWKNIYIFSVEVILLILAFYFMWLFKVYKKVIELYDSHILLIESDYYYKMDEYFLSIDSEKILEMRKENAQKIHDLPWKIFDIFNWKDSFTSDLPVWKALDIINNLTKK